MITSQTRPLFLTYREADKRQAKGARRAKTDLEAGTASPTDVTVDPLEMLRLGAHECRHITELHLANKRLTVLHGNLRCFINLEELWLNDNRLKRVEGLLASRLELSDPPKGCTRLKRLFLSHNLIDTVEGDVPRLHYLEVLLMAHNRLCNLEEVSQKLLLPLRFLRQLDLFGNPLSEEQNYRLYVIHRHPHIELLDRRMVTLDERREAASLFGRKAHSLPMLSSHSEGSLNQSDAWRKAEQTTVAFGTHVEPKVDAHPVGPISASAKLVEAKVRQLRLRQQAEEDLRRAAEEHEQQERAEKRRLFHSLWATATTPSSAPSHQGNPPKAGGVAAAAPARAPTVAYTPDPSAACSMLYDPSDKSSATARLIELARERELATTATRKAELDAQIAKAKHQLFPDRFGDAFAAAFARVKASSQSAADAEYDAMLLKTVFSSSEMDSLTRIFASNSLNVTDAVSTLNLIKGGDNVSSSEWGNFFKVKMGEQNVVSLPLRATLRILCDFTPFLDVRENLALSESRAAIVQGSGAVAANTFRVVSVITDHRRRLTHSTASPIGSAFSAVQRQPKFAPSPSSRDAADSD